MGAEKKRKVIEGQQRRKSDHTAKKGRHSSMEEPEAYAELWEAEDSDVEDDKKITPAAQKKSKLTEGKQWQKIDHMIKKGKHSSLEELEAYSSRSNRKQPPAPREIM